MKKKIKIFQTKINKAIIVQENHFQKTTIIIDSNHLIEVIFADDSQTEVIHKNSHKSDQ